MKKFLKRFTTLLLVLVMILEIAPVSIFAGGGGGSSETPIDRSSKTTEVNKTSGSTGYFAAGVPGRASNTANMDAYILAVALGRKQSIEFDSVIISYYTCKENKESGQPFHQVLEVNRKEGDSAINASIEAGVDSLFDASQNWPFYGSKYATFRSIVGKGTADSNGSSYYMVGDSKAQKHFSLYNNWAAALVPDVDTKKFPKAADKYAVVFPEFSTEYIRFRLEYNLYEIESIEFVASQTNTGLSSEFAINGWALFREDKSKGLAATNFAFVSDKLGLVFSGTPVARSTDAANSKTNQGIPVSKNLVLKYFNKALLPAGLDKNEEYPMDKYQDAYDIYRTPILGSTLATLCFTGAQADLAGVTAPEPKIYNFVINLADQYEAGIEAFNVVSGISDTKNALNLHDMLTARIIYVDNFGIRTQVSLPVISNALLEYVVPDDEANASELASSGLIKAIQSGQYLTYAQQGESICFSVEFPGISSIESISLSYFNQTNISDQIGISSVAVYDNWDVGGIRKTKDEVWSKYKSASQAADQAYQNYSSYYANLYQVMYGWSELNKAMANGVFEKAPVDEVAKKYPAVKERYNDWQAKKLAAAALYTLYKQYCSFEQSSNGDVAHRSRYVKNSSETISMDVGSNNNLVYLSNNKGNIWIDNGVVDYMFELTNTASLPEEKRVIPSYMDFSDMYLVSIKTSNVPIASSSADLIFSLDYIDKQNNKQNTSEVEIKEATKEFMGYVAGRISKDTRPGQHADLSKTISDVAYYHGINYGNTISFIVKAKNVDHFTGATFKLTNTDDEWQLGGMSITRVESYDKRQFVRLITTDYVSVVDNGEFAFNLNHTYSRSVKGETMFSDDTLVLLLQNKGEGHIDFIKGSTQSKSEKREDYSEYKYSMTYDMAASDLKLATQVKSYEVRVTVAPNSSNSLVADNSGSNNMFYFQLIFKDGTRSAYVLANKQLESDGFRSGMTESFMISTNKDCGDVAAVHIIADDVSSNSTPLDKLNIASLEVIKKNDNAPDKRFVADNIGWVSTAYIDTSEQTSRPTRSEAELANSVPIQYSAYMLGLEVSMAYGPYDEGIAQFEGAMTVDLFYENSAGEAKSVNVDVVKAMYDYMKKTAPIANDNGLYMSDKNLMFRAGHIDRFVIDVEDCVRIKRLVFHGDPLDNTAIPFKDITIQAMVSKGTLAINDDGEFYRVYDKGLEPKLVATLASTPKASYYFAYQQHGSASFYLSSSEFPKFEQDTDLSTIIPRVPDSSNDVINLYIYLDEDTPFPSVGDYDVLATVKYKSTVDSRIYVAQAETNSQKNRRDFTEATIGGKKVIYKTGLSATNFSAISSINVYSNMFKKTLKAEKAMIQQVRNGVVIDTMEIPLPGHIFSTLTGASGTGAYSAHDDHHSQQIRILLDKNTPTTTLTPEEKDIAVSFKYTSLAFGKGQYQSKNVFASDSGTTKIHAGSELVFNFDEYGVGEITEVDIMCSGGLIAYVDSTDGVSGITAVCLEGSTESKPVETARYSFYTPDEVKLDISTKRFNPQQALSTGANVLKNVDFAFKTMQSADVADSGGSAQLKATIIYKTSYGSEEIVVNDIRNYVSTDVCEDVFTAGQTAKISLMLRGFEGLVSVKIEPKDSLPENIAKWNLESMSYQVRGIADESKHTINVGKTIEEGQPYTIDVVKSLTPGEPVEDDPTQQGGEQQGGQQQGGEQQGGQQQGGELQGGEQQGGQQQGGQQQGGQQQGGEQQGGQQQGGEQPTQPDVPDVPDVPDQPTIEMYTIEEIENDPDGKLASEVGIKVGDKVSLEQIKELAAKYSFKYTFSSAYKLLYIRAR